jgi:tRNA pseudouridine38-40 synthase
MNETGTDLPARSTTMESGGKSEAAPRAFRLVLEYDGTNYAGWQRQAEALSVQQVLEEALERIVRHPVRCDAAGRTDAGVHALGQVVRILVHAHNVDAEALFRGTNTYLPTDVRIVSVEPCDAAFDPRRDARLRWYRYSLFVRSAAPALDRRRLHHLHADLDWRAVEKALEYFRGDHEFAAFRSSVCEAPRTRLTLVDATHVDERPVHHLDFRCRSFLHNMIRIMTGLLIEIGQGKHAPEVVREMLETGHRTASFRVAPPQGLVLMRVDYGEGLSAPIVDG